LDAGDCAPDNQGNVKERKQAEATRCDESSPENSGAIQKHVEKTRRDEPDQSADRQRQGSAQEKASSNTVIDIRKSKKAQLNALLIRPKGVRLSVIAERLNWQAHTVRAAISRLRKQGVVVSTSKAPRTGETVYAISNRSSANEISPAESNKESKGLRRECDAGAGRRR
jgi:ribosomal protein S25